MQWRDLHLCVGECRSRICPRMPAMEVSATVSSSPTGTVRFSHLGRNFNGRCIVPPEQSLEEALGAGTVLFFNLRDVHLNLHWHGASTTVRLDTFFLAPRRVHLSCRGLARHRRNHTPTRLRWEGRTSERSPGRAGSRLSSLVVLSKGYFFGSYPHQRTYLIG